ncbi:hypothetical protein GGS20DRAFT_555087 [Poronia punctata]|nr:hypothetical protein GGS20DRAFT_555087 [Poronia punctata]
MKFPMFCLMINWLLGGGTRVNESMFVGCLMVEAERLGYENGIDGGKSRSSERGGRSIEIVKSIVERRPRYSYDQCEIHTCLMLALSEGPYDWRL